MISGIILAAGESSRMGEVKALLDYRGKTFIETIIDNLKNAGVKEIIVVMGFHKEKIEPVIKNLDVTIAVNPEPQLGQLSSLKTGIGKVSSESMGAIITLVDQPAVNLETYKALVDVAQKEPEKIIGVSYHGKHGHPFVIPGNLFKSLLTLPANLTARDFTKSHPDLILELDVNDPGTLKNYNYKKDL